MPAGLSADVLRYLGEHGPARSGAVARDLGKRPGIISACMAALAVLHVVERDGLVGHAAEMEQPLREAIQDVGAKEVRGLGLMQAFEFEDAKETQEKAIQIAPDAKVSELRARLTLYHSGRPFRTTSRTARGEDPEAQR